jgi:hypothetical protein
MEKTYITPGKLYARLGEEFRTMRSPQCTSCQMPMVYVIEPLQGDCANWLVDELPHDCEHCEAVIREIVRRHAFQFEIFDPTATPACTPRRRGAGLH